MTQLLLPGLPGSDNDHLDLMADERPLPLIIADGVPGQWDRFDLQHNIDEDGNYWYAVQDWISGIVLCSLQRAREILKNLNNSSTMELNSIVDLPYEAGNGRVYELPHTDAEGLYQIAAYLRVTKKRKALQAIKDYLAAAGVFADEIRRDPEKGISTSVSLIEKKAQEAGKSDQWVDTRLSGVISRKRFTDALKSAVAEALATNQMYGQATDDVYKGVFNKNGREIKQHLGVKSNPRDHMSRAALHLLGLAETLCTEHLDQRINLSPAEARLIIKDVAELVGVTTDTIERNLGIDILTGLPQLGSGQPSAKRRHD